MTQRARSFNACDYLVGRARRDGRGAQDAVRGRETCTYDELDARTAVVAEALGAHLAPGERVLLVTTDGIEMLSVLLGAFRAGVVAVPVSTMLTGTELGPILDDSGAKLVVVSPEFAEAVGTALAAAPSVRTVVTLGDAAVTAPDGVHVVGWASFTEVPGDRPAAETDDDTQALWLYTSGTTGRPKAAMHRHANIRHVCETYGRQVLGIRADDVTFSVAKLFFAYGIGNSLFFPLSVGGTTVLEPGRPTPDAVAGVVTEQRPTLFFGVPTFYAALLASAIPDDTFASVRLAASAGEALPAPLLRRFKERFGVDIIDGIGSTEALHIFLSNAPDDIRPGTTGRAVPGYDLVIRGEDGAEVGPGQPGLLMVRGESTAVGYWQRPDVTAHVFRDGWLVTGDTYVRDADGYFTCLGRNSDMLKAGGIWVSPAEVESRLLEHPAVREAAVVGLADADGLDKPVAVVVADPAQAGADDLIAWCRDGLAHFKAPRQVVHVDELPKTATGKLQRFKVRAFLVAADEPEVVEPAPSEPAVAT